MYTLVCQANNSNVVSLEVDPTPLNLKWRRGKDMPIKMGSTVQSVAIEGLCVCWWGEADSDLDMCTVMKLDLQQDEWTQLRILP